MSPELPRTQTTRPLGERQRLTGTVMGVPRIRPSLTTIVARSLNVVDTASRVRMLDVAPRASVLPP